MAELLPYRVCTSFKCIEVMAFSAYHALLIGTELMGSKAVSAFLIPEWE
jgi:hypothetical protein